MKPSAFAASLPLAVPIAMHSTKPGTKLGAKRIAMRATIRTAALTVMVIGILIGIVIGMGAVFAGPAAAAILVTIDKTTQRLTVEMNGQELYNWPVSTGKAGYETPSGSFRAFRMEEDHFSKEWDNAPMPHSIFFTQRGHAIHGTLDAKHIGRPASRGCVRLSTEHARLLYDLVKQDGVLNMRVVLTGETPVSGNVPVASSRRAPRVAERQPGFDDDSDPSWWQSQQERQEQLEQQERRARSAVRARERRYREQPYHGGDDYAVDARGYYRYEEIAPRRYEYPDAPGRLYDQPRDGWGWR
jgi:lipoprotein-anchoring transpeptidase ErfK/SrfK